MFIKRDKLTSQIHWLPELQLWPQAQEQLWLIQGPFWIYLLFVCWRVFDTARDSSVVFMMHQGNGVLHTKRQCRHSKYQGFSLTCSSLSMISIFEDLATKGLLIFPFMFVAFFYAFLEPGLSFWLIYPVFLPHFPRPNTFWTTSHLLRSSFTFCERCFFAFSPKILVGRQIE